MPHPSESCRRGSLLPLDPMPRGRLGRNHFRPERGPASDRRLIGAGRQRKPRTYLDRVCRPVGSRSPRGMDRAPCSLLLLLKPIATLWTQSAVSPLRLIWCYAYDRGTHLQLVGSRLFPTPAVERADVTCQRD